MIKTHTNLCFSAILLFILSGSLVMQTYAQTKSNITTNPSATIGEYKLYGKQVILKLKRDVKARDFDVNATGEPIILSSARIEMQGNTLVAHGLIPASGEGFVKSATLTKNVRIVLRQEGDKHVITCNKATLESESVKGKKIIHLLGNVRDESSGIFGEGTAVADTGKIEWDGPIIDVVLDNSTIIVNPAPKSTPKSEKSKTEQKGKK